MKKLRRRSRENMRKEDRRSLMGRAFPRDFARHPRIGDGRGIFDDLKAAFKQINIPQGLFQ